VRHVADLMRVLMFSGVERGARIADHLQLPVGGEDRGGSRGVGSRGGGSGSGACAGEGEWGRGHGRGRGWGRGAGVGSEGKGGGEGVYLCVYSHSFASFSVWCLGCACGRKRVLAVENEYLRI
jgi:hypothetical protein